MPPERLPRPFRGGVDGAAVAAGAFSVSAGFAGTAAADVTGSRGLGSAAPAPAEGIEKTVGPGICRGQKVSAAAEGWGGKGVVVPSDVQIERAARRVAVTPAFCSVD